MAMGSNLYLNITFSYVTKMPSVFRNMAASFDLPSNPKALAGTGSAAGKAGDASKRL